MHQFLSFDEPSFHRTGLKSDKWIRRMAEQYGMVTEFGERIVRIPSLVTPYWPDPTGLRGANAGVAAPVEFLGIAPVSRPKLPDWWLNWGRQAVIGVLVRGCYDLLRAGVKWLLRHVDDWNP